MQSTSGYENGTSETVVTDESTYTVGKAVLPENGGYEAHCEQANAGKTGKGDWYISTKWVLDSAHDEATGGTSVGMPADVFITLYPDGVKDDKARRNRETLQRMLKALDISFDMFPKRLTEEGLKKFAEEFLVGRQHAIWTKQSPKKDDPNTIYLNVNFTAPKS